MRKRLQRLLLLALFAALVPSCEFLEDCKKCKLMVNDGGDITEETSLTYCGDKLAEIEAEQPHVVGNTTTYWDCQ